MGRFVYYPYQRLGGLVTPKGKPLLSGTWSEQEMRMGERWVMQGMQEFSLDYETAM